eukprot:CAMPEP_0182446712 /NCGR_PEP_ID=MMETSP1172-20130603/4719_1 /TAXON_ID=708627 /ORGANISM="Timspurckia oligopyrenoides, Strain CCMP3278" /LENGTH=159 /DNA_ID=CAMNT_0024642715 /DNA_START=211 /DNA_END=690 /DNA_ORIENTATION=-
MSASTLYEVKSLKDIDGNAFDSGSLMGKVVLAVNVACFCGKTKPGYSAMSNIAEKYGDKVAVLAFPSNEFGAQEPGTPDEIKSFVNSKFGSPKITLMEKSSVKGSSANEVFAMAKSAGMGEPKWNFDGRLIFDKSGKLVARLDNSSTESDLINEIEKYL